MLFCYEDALKYALFEGGQGSAWKEDNSIKFY